MESGNDLSTQRSESASDLAGLKSKPFGLKFATHGWVHWRSLYVRDAEGNNVELVCFDPSV